jgi:hypothetical protein
MRRLSGPSAPKLLRPATPLSFATPDQHAAYRNSAPHEAAQSLKGDVSVLQRLELERV